MGESGTMIDKHIITHLSDISLTLFRKNFFGIYNGSISKKLNNSNFIINTKDSIFDKINDKTLCQIGMNNHDYSLKLASMEAPVHNEIYNLIHESKYIACGMPPYTTAYSLEHNEIIFEDYFGKTLFDRLTIYDPKDFSTWYDRNIYEIPQELKKSKQNIIVIKGIGVYVYDRDMNELVKKVAILENSCRILGLKTQYKKENIC